MIIFYSGGGSTKSPPEQVLQGSANNVMLSFAECGKGGCYEPRMERIHIVRTGSSVETSECIRELGKAKK